MVWPSWLWIGTPLKFWVWFVNRLATWTGALWFWKRFRTRRILWLLLILLNVASLSGLCLIFFWLHARAPAAMSHVTQ